MDTKSLSTYIQSLDFSYLKIYSGLRGDRFEAFSKEIQQKIIGLEALLETARYMEKIKIGKQIETLKNQINSYNIRLISPRHNIHPSAKELAFLKKNDTRFPKLISFLNLETPIEAISRCIPIYREAIAFFNENEQIVAVIHICFECHQIIDEHENSLHFGTSAFIALENFFQQEFYL